MSKKRDTRNAFVRALNEEFKAFNAEQNRMRKRAIASGRSATPKAPPKPKRETPTFSECVIGYRVWSIDALGRLRPVTVNQRPWVPGVNVATCDADIGAFWSVSWAANSWGIIESRRPPKKHNAPHADCHCGYYSRFALHAILDREGAPNSLPLDQVMMPIVIGAVASWGKLQVHRDGMRAEKACVVALAIQDDMPEPVKELVCRVAETYRVAAVPLSLLELEANQHGTPLPDSAKPLGIPTSDSYVLMNNSFVNNSVVSSAALSAIWSPTAGCTCPMCVPQPKP